MKESGSAYEVLALSRRFLVCLTVLRMIYERVRMCMML
jgi:hypothetical protein